MQCQGQYSKRPNINISTRKVIFVVLFYDFCQENPFLSEKQPWVLKGRCCTWSELNHKFLDASDGEESFGCAYFELMSIDLGLRLIGQVGLLQRAWLWKGSDAQWVVRLWLMDWFSSWNCFSMFGECSMVFQSLPTELRVLKFPGGFYPCLVMKGTQKRCMVSLLLGWVVGSKPSWSCAPCLEKGWTVEGQRMGFEGACLFEGEGVTVV